MNQLNESNVDNDLVKFRNEYGKVARLRLDNIDIYIRPLYFDNWTKVVRETSFTFDDNNNIKHDIKDKTISKYILPCVIKPNPLPDEIVNKPIHLDNIVDTVLNITEFDDVEKMISKYKRALGKQQLIAMETKAKLISTYGVVILDYLKTASADDVIELIVIGEWMSQNPGEYAKLLTNHDIIPRNQRGKIDPKALYQLLNTWLYDVDNVPDTDGPETGSNDNVSIFDVNKQEAPAPVTKPKKQQPAKQKQTDINIFDVDTVNKKKKQPTKNNNNKSNVTTIDDIEETTQDDNKHKPSELDIERVKEPKLYDNNPENLDPMLRKRNIKEFGGNLVNLWNENLSALYDKIQEEAENPTEFKELGDIQKEDDKSNVVLGQ